jgi:hypothetical protein
MKNIFYDGEAKKITVLDDRFYQSSKNSDKYYPGVTTILECYPKGYGFVEWLKQTGYNAETILEKAAEQGSNIHSMIEMYLSEIEVKWATNEGDRIWTLAEWEMLNKFVAFYLKYQPEVLAVEFVFCEDELGYGGTIDLICKINDQIWLIDHKSSNYIHKSHELQLAAYCTAWNKLNPQYKIERTGIMWLRAQTRGEDKTGKKIQGSGWQLKEFDRNYEDGFKLFQHTQALWNEENPNYKPKNLFYPISFKLKNDK